MTISRREQAQFEEGRFGDKDRNPRDERGVDQGRHSDDRRTGQERQTAR